MLTLVLCIQMGVAGGPVPVRPAAPQAKRDAVLAEGKTVLMGTWSWKVDGNEQGTGEKSDVFWEQVSDTERNLVPRGEAGWAVIEGKAFEKVILADLANSTYSTGKLSGAKLRPGTVVALRTQDGRFAKLRVIRYRDLHDNNFPEAVNLPKGWIQFARRKPKVEEYHLELDWVLYRDKK